MTTSIFSTKCRQEIYSMHFFQSCFNISIMIELVFIFYGKITRWLSLGVREVPVLILVGIQKVTELRKVYSAKVESYKLVMNSDYDD